jgi:prevent-host-death family protein
MDHTVWYNLDMKEIAATKFKATCLAVVEDVRKTRRPVRITRFGKPVAEIVPVEPEKPKSWLGCMAGTMEIVGDIVGPIYSLESKRWPSKKKRK